MKKLLCMLLCLTLLCGAALPAAADQAADEPTALTMLDCLREIKQDEFGDAYWLPLWQGHAELEGFEMLLSGVCCWDYQVETELFSGHVVVGAHPPITGAFLAERFSPFQQLMLTHHGDPMQIQSQPLAACRHEEAISVIVYNTGVVASPAIVKTESKTYGLFFDRAAVGEYAGSPAAYLQYIRRRPPAGDPYTCSAELAVSKSPYCLMSVRLFGWQYKGTDNPFETLDLPKLLGLSFTTTGDADLNGQVNAVDGLLTLKHAVQKAEIADELAFALADWNDDGALDATDALHTLQKAVGKAR